MINRRISAPAVIVTTLLALGSAGAASAGGGSSHNPYQVNAGGVLMLNKTPTRQQSMNICQNEAAFRHLTGQGRGTFLHQCETSA